MGVDLDFRVHCEKVISLRHTFTTDKPWKESKALIKQGFTIVNSTEKYVDVEKTEKVNIPEFRFNNCLAWFKKLQQLYHTHYIHYKQWCHWNLNHNYMAPLYKKKEILSTLQVWDELWKDIFEDIDEHERKLDELDEQEDCVDSTSSDEDKDKDKDVYARYERRQRKEELREKLRVAWYERQDSRYNVHLAKEMRDIVRHILQYAADNDNIRICIFTETDY